MKTVSGKKKVTLPNIQIFGYVPYRIVPLDVQNPQIPFTNPDEGEELPFAPPRIIQNDPPTIHMIPRSKPPMETSKLPKHPVKHKENNKK